MSVSKIGMFVYSDEGRGMRYSSRYLKKAADKAKEVFVLQPGYAGGKVVNQRRGSRKFSIVVEGGSMRIGTRSNRTDVLTWFLQRVDKINGMSEHEKKLSVVVQDVHSERYSMLMPHRVKAAVYITYLDSEIADYTEKQIKEIFKSDTKSINSYVEKLEERPPMLKINKNKNIIVKLKEISEEWKLPFGIESSLLPSAAGEISQDIPVLCGLAPASYDMYTPQESIHRGELIQKTLLLTFYLLNKIK
jgi:D-alanine-D-alanine ligase